MSEDRLYEDIQALDSLFFFFLKKKAVLLPISTFIESTTVTRYPTRQ
jgi:hypothetical protein